MRLCEMLLSKRRFDDAAELAREGLQLHSGEGRLLHLLSKAEAQLGRPEAALASARAAREACGSQESLLHLLRLLLRTRRFDPGDGEWLRQALERDRRQPLVLHAAAVFEALHGNPWAARGILCSALDRERRAEVREEITAELSLLDGRTRGTKGAPESDATALPAANQDG